MKRNALFLASALAVAGLGAATLALAQSAASDKPQRMHLDADNDGVIDRTEAAKLPRLAAKFDQLDRNGDGRLDASERPQRHGKGKHGGRHGDMSKLDTDNDGRISRAEAAGRDRLAGNFAAIDADSDSYLTRGELQAYHARMRPQREAERAQRFEARFAEADLNRDGRLSRGEVDEKMPRLAERFNWLDDNRDGFLGRDELQSKGGHH